VIKLMPNLVGGVTVHPATPGMMAREVPAWIRAGAGIISACCGSTPAHTEATMAAVKP